MTRPVRIGMLTPFARMSRPPNDVLWSRLATPEPPELGQGPRSRVKPLAVLQEDLSLFFRDQSIESGRAHRLRAVALLYHDHHDEAHDLVQDLSDADGALIHGILHRREPDYWNAKYWFRRFVAHPAHLALGKRLRSLATTPVELESVAALTLPGAFDPFGFVDACEAAAKTPPSHPTVTWLRRVQQAEFEDLINHLLS